MAAVQRICRYVVKGLSEEVLEKVTLAASSGLPNDRRYALAFADTPFDPEAPRPLPKIRFAVLMRHARLAELACRYDDATSLLEIRHDGSPIACGALSEPDGRDLVAKVVSRFVESSAMGPIRLVEAAGHRFTDISVISPAMMEAISLINLASVRAFEEMVGYPVDPRRFRGNILIDGLEPWEEFSFVGRRLRIGNATVTVASRTKRCAATEVNPDTAARDLRVPAELLRHLGHGDMGVYATVDQGGVIRTGDSVWPL